MPSTETKIKTKKATVKPAKETVVEIAKPRKYFEAVGRRKTSIARARIFKGDGKITVNGKDFKVYFPLKKHQTVVRSPLESLNIAENFSATLKVLGGGITGQAEAIRHSLSRALVKLNPNYKKRLRKAEYLTRDPRAVERKKYGLKKARRAPQWAKR
ncbi:MAG: 30S ribosomal protein S9 [Candidatus Liptonbacteria bacterium]|nr:30S ribosomal protein S9 [Candidatus Liptonbacteria bacterium]